MQPDEIEATEFFVGIRGYERAEVRAFLRTVAEEHRRLQARIAALEEAPPSVDPSDRLGRHVAGIVRAAREAADAVVADAHDEAARRSAALLEEAEAERSRIQAACEELRAKLRDAVSGAELVVGALGPAAEAVVDLREPAPVELSRLGAGGAPTPSHDRAAPPP